MDVIAHFKDTREISKVIDPTVTAFAPLLKRKKQFIREIPSKSFTYGPEDRQQLDVYYPVIPSEGKTPVLFFIYGGGFNTGERSISPKSFGLVYACVGAFFARRGYLVVIPDYRLVPQISYPTPAEDIRDSLRWVNDHPENLVSAGSPTPDGNTIIMMGHSAGAAHIATMLFDTNVLSPDDELRNKIVAAILESPPYDLSAMTMDWPTADIHSQYWGTLDLAKENDPVHLYRRLQPSVVDSLPKILTVEAEREPQWLLDAGAVFRNAVKERTGIAPQNIVAMGHNHISLNWALSTGEGEEWAEEVAAWMEGIV